MDEFHEREEPLAHGGDAVEKFGGVAAVPIEESSIS
jgi:hypothetical protein